MKYLSLLFLLLASAKLTAQIHKPTSISASYFGESITHPGLKIGVNYQLKNWEKTKTRKSLSPKKIYKNIDLSPSIGLYYHKDYQTGLFVIPELSYTRKNAKGNFVTYGIGAGYMRTFIPNVFVLNSSGEVKKVHEGNNYFITNYSIAFGKDLSIKKKLPASIFVKPQLLYAVPSFSKGVAYFALELGLSYRFPKTETKKMTS